MFAGDDDDLVVSGLGDDYLDGGAGDDQLWGHGGNDVLDGGAGNDILVGGIGIDVMFGDARNGVTLTARYEGDDILYGEADEVKCPYQSVGYSHLRLKLYRQASWRPATVLQNPQAQYLGIRKNRGSHACKLHERMKAMRADRLAVAQGVVCASELAKTFNCREAVKAWLRQAGRPAEWHRQ